MKKPNLILLLAKVILAFLIILAVAAIIGTARAGNLHVDFVNGEYRYYEDRRLVYRHDDSPTSDIEVQDHAYGWLVRVTYRRSNGSIFSARYWLTLGGKPLSIDDRILPATMDFTHYHEGILRFAIRGGQLKSINVPDPIMPTPTSPPPAPPRVTTELHLTDHDVNVLVEAAAILNRLNRNP